MGQLLCHGKSAAGEGLMLAHRNRRTELYLTENGGELFPAGFTQIEAVPGPFEVKSPSQGILLTARGAHTSCKANGMIYRHLVFETHLASRRAPCEAEKQTSCSIVLVSGCSLAPYLGGHSSESPAGSHVVESLQAKPSQGLRHDRKVGLK